MRCANRKTTLLAACAAIPAALAAAGQPAAAQAPQAAGAAAASAAAAASVPGRDAVAATTDPAPLAGAYDLRQIVEMAVATYPSIRDAAASVGQQQAGVDVARAGYYPSVQIGTNAGYQGTYGAGPAASASVSQTVYDFGKVRSAVAGAQSNVRTSQLQVRAETDRVATQAALTAIELQRHTALEAAARAQLDAVIDLHALAQKRSALGASNRADPAQAEARVAAARAALDALRSQVSQQRTRLATLIGRAVPPGGVAIAPDALGHAVAGIRPAIDDAVNVQLAASMRDTAVADLAHAKASTRPSVQLQAGIDQQLGGRAHHRAPGGRSYTVTLGLTHTLFDGGAPRARVRGAAEALRGADERIRAEKLLADDERRVHADRIASLSARLATLDARAASIAETQKLYRQQYLSLGNRSLLDLLNSESEVFQAQSDRINARHDLWAAEIGYVNATGHMRDVFGLGNA